MKKYYIGVTTLLVVVNLMQVLIFTQVDHLKRDIAELQEQVGTTVCYTSVEQADNALTETEN